MYEWIQKKANIVNVLLVKLEIMSIYKNKVSLEKAITTLTP